MSLSSYLSRRVLIWQDSLFFKKKDESDPECFFQIQTQKNPVVIRLMMSVVFKMQLL